MNNLSIPEGTDLNDIISKINDSRGSIHIDQHDLYFPDWIFDAMPGPLPQLFKEYKSNAKKDTTLLALVSILSALIKDYFVFYDDKREGVQLYTYILGDPAQGKGSVAKAMEFGMEFHKELLEQNKELLNEYKFASKEWEQNDKSGEEPEKPKRKVLFVSGNSSKASLIRDLSDNNGYGLLFETETDTLYAANKSEFGNFSDILRKGFHSENLSVSRIGFDEGTIEIDQVKLSVLMTSTLDQLFKLIPTYENGLFSRFIFYILPPDLEFKKVFRKANTKRIDKLIEKISELFKDIGFENLKHYDKEFTLTDAQEERFDAYFQYINSSIIKHGKQHLKGNINRLGLICTRLAMIFTYLRNFIKINCSEYSVPNSRLSIQGEVVCNEIDFDISLSIVQKIICHVLAVDNLYHRKSPKQGNNLLIHSGKRHSNITKLEAIRLRETGKSYSEIAKEILGDEALKGTIQKWVVNKNSIGVSVSETETARTNKRYIDVKKALQDATVSYFDSVSQKTPSAEIELFDLLTTDLFKDYVQNLRKANPETQKQLKRELPAYTVSGIFDETRKKEHLKTHSGFICIDIDEKDNKRIENFATLKSEVRKIVNIAFVGTSVSGKGLYAVIPIDKQENHEKYFTSLQEAFSQLGISIDKSCKDVSRLRIVSYDSDYYMPKRAVVVGAMLESQTEISEYEFIDHVRLNDTVKRIEKQKIDITTGYPDWFAIGCAMANSLGESGRAYYHMVSKFYERYSKDETDKQFSACLENKRTNGYNLGTFFYLADQHGVTNVASM